ncbi:MAG: co-chaperone GroES, partial [Planctomycetes bacterium]|nr:co-chaperone GroES [Planctomycetota bacterium]
IGDKVLVQRSEAQEKTAAGIYLPESAKGQPKEGKIIALGNGVLNKETGEYMPFTVKKGDRVIFTSYAGTEIKDIGDELLIMSEDDILGVIE